MATPVSVRANFPETSVTDSAAGGFVLASASPRRLQLLAGIGITPDRVVPANIDETPISGEKPHHYANRMAAEKAAVTAALCPDAVVLAADTVVAIGRRVLGKPEDRHQAEHYLNLLSGRRHRVLTAIAIATPQKPAVIQRLVTSQVRMKRLDSRDLHCYLQSGEWQGVAGGYAIQGLAASFIPWISGSWSGIVGLPLAETAALLAVAGIRPIYPAPPSS